MERFRNVLCLSRRTKRQQSRHAENYQTSPHVHLPEARAHPRPDQRSVEAPLLADIAHFGRSDEAAMSDPDGGERAIKVMCPEIQEFDETGKSWSKVVVLPDEGLQDVVEIGQAIHDLRRGKAPTTQLTFERSVAHIFLLEGSFTIP